MDKNKHDGISCDGKETKNRQTTIESTSHKDAEEDISTVLIRDH